MTFKTGDRIESTKSDPVWKTYVGETATVGDPAYIRTAAGTSFLNVIWDKKADSNRCDGGFSETNFQHLRKFKPGDRVRHPGHGEGTVIEYVFYAEFNEWYVTVKYDKRQDGYPGWGEWQLKKIDSNTDDFEARLNKILEVEVNKALDSVRASLLDSLRTELNKTLNLNLGA